MTPSTIRPMDKLTAARIARRSQEIQAQLAWSHSRLVCPPPAPLLRWTCTCGFQHETPFYGGTATYCGCNCRREWRNVVDDPAALEAAQQAHLNWFNHCKANGIPTTIQPGYDKAGAP